MIKDRIIQTINYYLGKYVEDLDSDKVNYSFLKGDVELRDLSLRPDAVVELLTLQLGQELPIEVKAGHIEYIKFSLPWVNLFSADVRLELDGLYVLLGPINDRPYDDKKDKDLENAIKQAKLQAFEQSALQGVADQAKKNPGFFLKLGQYILNNIQITIKNVHIRYEDSVTNGDYSFAVGGMLQSFSIHSTNDRWEEANVDSSAKILHKLGKLSNMSLYWNHYVQEPDLVGKKKKPQSYVWKDMLKQSITTYRVREEAFTPVLKPVSAEAKVIMNNEENFIMPKIYVEFSLPDINCHFSRHQYLNLLKWIDSSQRIQINRRYRKHQPDMPVRFSAKAWWHYFYTAVVEERVRPFQWRRIVRYRKQFARYKELYKTNLEYPDNKTIEEDLRKLERDMDVCNIIAAREDAKFQFAKEAPERAKRKKEKEKKKSSWWNWLTGGGDEEEENIDISINEEKDWLSGLSEDEKLELYHGVGYDENANETKMPKEYIAYKIQTRLRNCSMTLENYGKPILQVSLSDMLTSYENRPGGEGVRVLSNTESFTVEGASVDYKLVSLLTSNSGIYSTDNQMFTLDYEVRPVSLDVDQSLKLNVRPVEIFYDQHAVSQVLMFFQVPVDSPQVDINSIAMKKLKGVMEYSRDTLLYAIEQHSTFHINVHMRSPYIVIPQKGTLHQGGDVLIADLGTFTVESELQPKGQSLQNATITELQTHLYDKFQIKITEVKVLLADSEEDDWHMAQKDTNSNYHILPSTGLEIAFYKSVMRDNHQLPQQKFDARLQSLTLNVTDTQLVILNEFVQHFPVPTTTASTSYPDGPPLETPLPQPDPLHIQLDMNYGQLRKMKRRILSRTVLEMTQPLIEEVHLSAMDVSSPFKSPDDEYYSASDDSDDELDKWASFRKVKSVDDYISENNRMKMFLRASIGEIVIQVSLDQNRQRREYLMFRMDGFCADMAYTVWIRNNEAIPSGVAFHARLGGIRMADKLHRGASGAYLDLLSSESEKELISISYRQVKPESPDFGPVFKYIEHGATLIFSNMSIMFDQTGICHLKKFIEDLQIRMMPPRKTLPDGLNLPELTSTDFSGVRKDSRISKAARRNSSTISIATDKLVSLVEQDMKKMAFIKMHLITCVQDVSLHLRNVETKIAEMHVIGLESQLIATAKKLTFNCRLKELSIQDLSPKTLYPHILRIEREDDPFFDMKVEKFLAKAPVRVSRRAKEPLDYFVRLHIGHLQMAFINKFFWQITRFFEPLKTPEMSEAASAAMENVSKQVSEISPSSMRIGLHVNMHNPTIVIPKHSKSPSLFFAKFGNLKVSNQFEKKETTERTIQEWNHFSASLTSMQVNRGNLIDDNFVMSEHLIEPVTFKASFSLALPPYRSKVMYDISGELDLIKVNLLQGDLKMMLDIQQQNLGEGAPKTIPDLAKPAKRRLTSLSTIDAGSVFDANSAEHSNQQPNMSFNFVVTLQGLLLRLLEEDQSDGPLNQKTFLSRFEIGKMEARANSYCEGEDRMDVNLSLQNLTIDDMRPDSNRAVKNVFYCTRNLMNVDQTHGPLPLISVIYKASFNGNQEADIRMEKVTLNLNVPFLMRLWNFYNVIMGMENAPASSSSSTSQNPKEESQIDAGSPENVSSLKVFCTVKEPEIILFADPANDDSRIIVLKADIEVDMLQNQNMQRYGSKVKSLKMYSAMYSTQHKVSSWVIHPCDMDLERTWDLKANKIDMVATMKELTVCVSPSVLHFVFDIWDLLHAVEKQDKLEDTPFSQLDNQNLWKVKQTSASTWLKKIDDVGSAVNPLAPERPPSETLKLDIQQINAYFQIRNMDHHVDLLHVKSSLDCELHDLTKQFHMKAELHIQAHYFNEKLCVWEPLVEPVAEKEGVYRPWEVVIKVIQGRSYPMMFNYVQDGFDMEECLRHDVQQMLHHSRHRSSSSESETDESTEMTVIRPKLPRKRSRIASDKSYDSVKQGSIQGESDTEPDGLIHSITNKLGGIFSDDSSEDADVSETDETDELLDPSLDKPVFLTPKGPIQVSRDYGGLGYDEVDSGQKPVDDMDGIDDSDIPQCNYVIIASQDKLLLNVTPQAINVVTDLTRAMTAPESLDFDSKDLPAFELHNELGIHTTVTLHSDIKIHKKHITNCTVNLAGEDNAGIPIIITRDDDDTIERNEGIGESETDGFLSRALVSAGHLATSAGAFVFDDDDDYLSGEDMDKNRLRLQVDGFNLSSTVLHKRACRRLLPLTPDKNKNSTENKHSTKYWFVLDIDVMHGRKVINILSPLQIVNSLTLPLNVMVKTDDLRQYPVEGVSMGDGQFTRLVCLEPEDQYNVPMFLAYHCDLYVCPELSRYQIHNKGIWWRDLLMTKEKAKCFTCQGSGDDRSFNLKVLCKDGAKRQPAQDVPKGVPYYTLYVKPPVMIHNYLPYDIQFSLEGTGSFSSLTHGDNAPLYTVDQSIAQKLHIQMQDYLGCDWSGMFEITQGLEEFKAVAMAPYDCANDENANKHLTIIVNAKEKMSLDLYFYSPYWVLNKTDLPVQIRGSGSDAVFDCPLSNVTPLLFRFKKLKRRKAKVRVYNSKWSQSFSMDTIGNVGVIVSYDKERQKKYKLMLQCQWSHLKLSQIVTILPFYIVANNSSRNLRYMEENEETDLWEDIKVGKCAPFWPRTSNDKMFVKFESSMVVSEHFPINTLHNTVLRMENGSALCVEVTGGIETPRTITFTDYSPGDAPVRVENLCDDAFIVIHQKNQHQMTVLAANQCILYTWDDPTGPRKLMWNVYGCSNRQDAEVDITKDGFNFKQLTVPYVRGSSTHNPTQGKHDSSSEDDSDVVDNVMGDEVDNVEEKTTMLKTKNYKMKIYWVSFLDGQQRVILFTRDLRVANAARMNIANSLRSTKHNEVPAPKMNEGEQASLLTMVSLDGVVVSVINEAYEEVALVSVTSMPALWEIEVKDKWKVLEDVTLVTWLEDKWQHGLPQASLEDRIEVDFTKMQMTKPYMGELCRVCPPGMLFQYRHSVHQTFFHAKVHKIQIDNQLHDAYYQTVLHPAPIPMSVVKKKGPKPFIEFGMIRRTVPENNVDTVRQFQVIMQEFSVLIDWGFIESIQDTFADLIPQEESESLRLQSDLVLAQKQLQELADSKDTRCHRVFYEMFKLSPLKLHVSFSFRGTPHLTKDVQPSLASDIKEFLRNSIGATFIEVKDVELKMGYFERRGMLMSTDQLTAQIGTHYRHQLIQQVYVLILGLDVLGNPYGLIQDISQGLGDLFYEPLLDTIQGDDEFSENVVRGFQSAMGHIVGGTANSVARITGTFGNALAYLSMDGEFQKKRRRRLQQQPADLPHSMALAGKGFLTGVKYGLTGIVLDPYQGASDDGVEGFFKGIGKGILGLITQPIGGVLDMVSVAFDGVRRAAEIEGGVVMRMRLPRFLDQYRGLKPYSEYRARGNHILKGLKAGKYAKSDVFMDFAPLCHEEKSDLVVITSRHILFLEKSRFSGGYDLEWELELQAIVGIPIIMESENKLLIKTKDSGGTLFSGDSVAIQSSELDILKWIQRKIERVLRFHIYT